ncbi:hypothetical protein Y032_0774g2244 [Ancylostoma ceylanicum]|nr:hypothetical protein Y032_0774g2244 [Ancylostoma ceylanicum]
MKAHCPAGALVQIMFHNRHEYSARQNFTPTLEIRCFGRGSKFPTKWSSLSHSSCLKTVVNFCQSDTTAVSPVWSFSYTTSVEKIRTKFSLTVFRLTSPHAYQCLLTQTLACRAHLVEGSARSEPSVASRGAEGNSTVSKTQVTKVTRFCRSRSSQGAEQMRNDFQRMQMTRDARLARATITLGARNNAPCLQENLQELRSSITRTPPVGATCRMNQVERRTLFTRQGL